MTDEEMRARLSEPTKGKQLILLDGDLYHPDERGGWEAYPPEDTTTEGAT
jgi:hypothetical protein